MQDFKKKTYRNIFKEIGKTDEEINTKIKAAVNTFFYGNDDERIYHPAGDDLGYLEDTGNNDARTEGMSYGMMMCVQLDMQEEFDRIWKWAKTYMYMEDGENEGYFAWSCATDGKKNANGPAPDGEEFFAMALFFASHRWGDREGIFNYSREADNILKAMLHKGENGRAGSPMWNRDNHLILFVPGIDFTDASYHLPHFYELFSMWIGNEEDRIFLKKAALASREYLKAACDPVTGLNPEYGEFDGTPMKRKLPWSDEKHDNFYSDAYRTAANIGLDCEWFGGHYDAPLKQMRFLKTALEAARCVYTTDGKPLDKTVLHPVGLLAATAQGALSIPYEENAALGSDYDIAKKWVNWFWNEPLRSGKRRYYDNCLYMFALLALSGNYRIW